MNQRKKRFASIGTITLALLLILAVEPAAASPSEVFNEAINQIFGEVSSIATAILFAYGMIQVIKLGVSSDTSNAMKKIGVSWGIAIIIQAWEEFQGFITDAGDDVSQVIVPPEAVDAVVETTAMVLTLI